MLHGQITNFIGDPIVKRIKETRAYEKVLVINAAGERVRLSRHICPSLIKAGFSVAQLTENLEDLMFLNLIKPDVVILDTNATCNMEVCHQYYSQGIPVILIDQSNCLNFWWKGMFGSRIGHCLKSHVSQKELITRVKAILLRCKRGKSLLKT